MARIHTKQIILPDSRLEAQYTTFTLTLMMRALWCMGKETALGCWLLILLISSYSSLGLPRTELATWSICLNTQNSLGLKGFLKESSFLYSSFIQPFPKSCCLTCLSSWKSLKIPFFINFREPPSAQCVREVRRHFTHSHLEPRVPHTCGPRTWLTASARLTALWP